MPKASPLRLGVNVDHVATLRNARGGLRPDPVRAALVAIEAGAPEVADGIRSASPLGGAEVEGPVLLGEGVEIGEGARIAGPAVIGDGCRIGAGAYLRDAILLDGAQVASESMLVGGIAGRVDRP